MPANGTAAAARACNRSRDTRHTAVLESEAGPLIRDLIDEIGHLLDAAGPATSRGAGTSHSDPRRREYFEPKGADPKAARLIHELINIELPSLIGWCQTGLGVGTRDRRESPSTRRARSKTVRYGPAEQPPDTFTQQVLVVLDQHPPGRSRSEIRRRLPDPPPEDQDIRPWLTAMCQTGLLDAERIAEDIVYRRARQSHEQ